MNIFKASKSIFQIMSYLCHLNNRRHLDHRSTPTYFFSFLEEGGGQWPYWVEYNDVTMKYLSPDFFNEKERPKISFSLTSVQPVFWARNWNFIICFFFLKFRMKYMYNKRRINCINFNRHFLFGEKFMNLLVSTKISLDEKSTSSVKIRVPISVKVPSMKMHSVKVPITIPTTCWIFRPSLFCWFEPKDQQQGYQ